MHPVRRGDLTCFKVLYIYLCQITSLNTDITPIFIITAIIKRDIWRNVSSLQCGPVGTLVTIRYLYRILYTTIVYTTHARQSNRADAIIEQLHSLQHRQVHFPASYLTTIPINWQAICDRRLTLLTNYSVIFPSKMTLPH